MKAALIPPKGLYNTAVASDYHLALAQITQPAYLDFYESLPGTDFVIMDNGAAEDATVTDKELYEAAFHMNVNEIVIPDVMLDAEQTYSRAKVWWSEWHKLLPPDLTVMVVVQGRTVDECKTMIQRYRREFPDATLALPRHLVTTLFKSARCKLVNHIKDFYGEVPVHLLGTHPAWPREVLHMGLHHSWVRGIDSSLPYNYTLAGVALDAENAYPTISRPDGYFTQDYSDVDYNLLGHNINTFLRWAHGTEGTQS